MNHYRYHATDRGKPNTRVTSRKVDGCVGRNLLTSGIRVSGTEPNAELGITFLMSSRIKCGVSGANVLWERTSGDFTPHYPKTLLLSGDRLVGEEDAR